MTQGHRPDARSDGRDAVVIRHSYSGAAHRLATWVQGSVVNAGDGTREHRQALLDAFTIRRRLRGATGDLDGLRVAIVGDVLHSRVARSNVALLTTLGARSPWSPRPLSCRAAWRTGRWPASSNSTPFSPTAMW